MGVGGEDFFVMINYQQKSDLVYKKKSPNVHKLHRACNEEYYIVYLYM